MDKIRTVVSSLPEGWVKEVVIRKSGASAGKSDIYYYSPDGKKCRSKPQMLQYLPEDFDIENFDFRTGMNMESVVRKRKGRKADFNYGKDFSMVTTDIKPNRQLKREREKIDINLVNNEEQHLSQKCTKRISASEFDAKRRRAENLSQRCIKPKQLFWQRRLQHLKAVSVQTLEECRATKLDDIMRDLLPGSNNQALLTSIWHSLFIGNKVVGQHASVNALRKHPTALCNIDQPFSSPFTITDDMLRTQEKRVEIARKKLCEAQELLSALAAEDYELDDIED